MMKTQMEKMSNEVILLSSRNGALDKENEDLMALLEERDYEMQMLKTGFAANRNNKSRANIETFEDMEFTTGFDAIDEIEESMEFEDDKQEAKKPQRPEMKKVADITREYLYLTANVVNIKL